MDDVRGTVDVGLSGPTENFDQALAALRDAGITADRDVFQSDMISARFHNGMDNPPTAFIAQCSARAGEAVVGTGFMVERAMVWASNAATRQLAYNRHTGEWLGQVVDTDAPLVMREEQLQDLADQMGISVTDIELRDPDYLTVPTE
jgi:hypothetical protein